MPRDKQLTDKDGNKLIVGGIPPEQMDGFSKHKRARRLVGVHAEGVWLTPKQARGVAAALYRLAAWAEKKT